jgi:hypothetical protein
MRYALYFEFDPSDGPKVYERNEKIHADRAKNPDKYPKDVYPVQGHLFGKPAGFYVVEGTHEQVFNFVHAWMGYKRFRVEPVKFAEDLRGMQKKAIDI